MKLILNSLLIILLSGLVLLLILLFSRKNKAQLGKWCIVLAILSLVTGLLRLVVFKEEHAATSADSLSIKQPAGKFSPVFNQSVDSLFSAYLRMVNLFDKGNPGPVEEEAKRLKTALESLDIEELVADTVLYDAVYLSLDNARAETAAIIEDPDITEKRASLNILSQELFNMLSRLGIQKPGYLFFICPAAFGKGNAGYWIGDEKGTNPYGVQDCKEVDKPIGSGIAEQTKTK